MQSQEHCLDNLLTNPKLVKGQSGLSSNLGGEATPFTQNSDDLPIEAEDFPALQVCCFDSQSYIDAIFCWSILLHVLRVVATWKSALLAPGMARS